MQGNQHQGGEEFLGSGHPWRVGGLRTQERQNHRMPRGSLTLGFQNRRKSHFQPVEKSFSLQHKASWAERPQGGAHRDCKPGSRGRNGMTLQSSPESFCFLTHSTEEPFHIHLPTSPQLPRRSPCSLTAPTHLPRLQTTPWCWLSYRLQPMQPAIQVLPSFYQATLSHHSQGC